jgi:hypothetical protein
MIVEQTHLKSVFRRTLIIMIMIKNYDLILHETK